MSSKKVVKFFYDVISPYSWFGLEAITRHAKLWEPKGVQVQLMPMKLSTIMRESGNKPPLKVPAKGMYMIQDLDRMSSFLKVPLKIPGNFPDFVRRVDEQEKQMLFVTAVDMITQGSGTESISREFYRAIFRDHIEVGKLPFEDLAKKAGLANDVVDQVSRAASSQEVKDRLEGTSKQAVSYGAFGAPSSVLLMPGKDPMLFFGCDRIELLAHVMGVEYGGSLSQFSQL